MDMRIVAAVIAFALILGASDGFEDRDVVEPVSYRDRSTGRVIAITTRHIRRYLRGKTLPLDLKRIVAKIMLINQGSGKWKLWAARVRQKFNFYLGEGGFYRSISSLSALLYLSLAAVPTIADPLGINPCGSPGGCWHSADSGVNKEAHSSALYRESWPTSADGTYTNGDTISGDMSWSVGGVDRTCTVSENKLTLDKNTTGSVNHLTVTKVVNLAQKQSIVFDVQSETEVGRHGGILLYGNTGATAVTYFYIYNDKITLDSTDYTIDMTTERRVELVMDFIGQNVICYIDGDYALTESMTNPLNAIDKIIFYHASSEVGSSYFGNIFIADTLDNIGVQFSDSLNEDTLSDYTLAGDTNPTYDSTEKAIELRDVTNLANQTSIAYQDFDCPQDEITFKFQAKIGTNDSSTDGRLMDIRLRSKVDTDTYVAVYYNGANIFLENVIDGAVSGTGNIAIALGNTSHDFEVIIRLQSHVYLFIDTIEYVEITPTKIKRFYDGQGYFQSQHDAGEESEIFIKNIAVDDSPIVNAPRSTPPGLITSGTRVDVGNTFWEDLKGYWGTTYATMTVNANGIYGNTIKQAYDGVHIPSSDYHFDSATDMSKYHTLRFIWKTNAADGNENFYMRFYDSSTYKAILIKLNNNITGKQIVEIPMSNVNVVDLTDIVIMRFNYQTTNVAVGDWAEVSDIQLLGGPEHDLRGQPLYTNAGIDDIDEWALSGDTNPVWNGGGSAFEHDHTNVGGGIEQTIQQRTTGFKMNGVGVVNFSYQIQATDTNTYVSSVVAKIYISISDQLTIYYDSVGQDWNIYMESNNVAHYISQNVAFAKDNNWHDVVIFFHKDYGLVIFIDEKMYNYDYTIAGVWDDWPSNPSLDLLTQVSTIGQRSHVFFKDASIERYPHDVHQFQSNEWFAATDTLSPNTGTDIDGDWTSNIAGINVQANGGALHDGKWIQLPGAGAADYIRYTFDSPMDIRGYKYLHGFCYHTGAVPASVILHMHTDAANFYTCTVTTKGWSFHEKLTPTDGSNGDFGVNGAPDPSSIAYVEINQNIGAPHTVGVQCLQFVSEQYANESFIPQILKVKDHSIDAGEYGSFYMGSGEKARIYQLELDGDNWLDACSIKFLDLWGAGLQGEGTWKSRWIGPDLSSDGGGNENHLWGFNEGSWYIPGAVTVDYLISRDGSGIYHGDKSQISDWSSSTVEGSAGGILEANSNNTIWIRALSTGAGGSPASDMPFHPLVNGSKFYLEEGLVDDDVGTLIADLIDLANGTQWEWGVNRTIDFMSFSVTGTGFFSVFDGIALVTRGILFNDAEVENNTVGAGKFIEALGGGASWTHTRRLKGIEKLYGTSPFTNIRSWTNLDTWTNLLKWT